MIELPYFKFFPNQWLTGTIAFQDFDVQGAFMKVCCFYWSKGCKVSDKELKAITGTYYNTLIDTNLIKVVNKKIKIKWLDEQLEERTKAHNKRVEAGRKGGKQCSSKAVALRKEKIKKDNTPYLSTKGLNEYLSTKK
jgi:hypothetical protein|tara:strand:- start:2065 stop:2475 length:411 start_codon:yes stop_codon:yes gene_type:complete